MDATVEDEVTLLPTCEIYLQGHKLAYGASDAVQKRLAEDPKMMAYLLVNAPNGGTELVINDLLEQALSDQIYARLTDEGWELRNFTREVAKALIAHFPSTPKNLDNIGFTVPWANLTVTLRLP